MGLDLSTLPQAQEGKTVLALLEQQKQHLFFQAFKTLETDEALLEQLASPSYVCCGIDAPLSLPPCLRCEDAPCQEQCPFERWSWLLDQRPDLFYHYRLADVIIKKSLKHISPKPPLSRGGPVDITPLTLRWLRLSRHLKTLSIPTNRLQEIYASGTAQLYAQKLHIANEQPFHYRKNQQLRQRLLDAIARQKWLKLSKSAKQQAIESEDAFDALMAALSAWHHAAQQTLTPEQLLGLSESPSAVRPLSNDITIEDRIEMARLLSSGDWMRLPNLDTIFENKTPGSST